MEDRLIKAADAMVEWLSKNQPDAFLTGKITENEKFYDFDYDCPDNKLRAGPPDPLVDKETGEIEEFFPQIDEDFLIMTHSMTKVRLNPGDKALIRSRNLVKSTA